MPFSDQLRYYAETRETELFSPWGEYRELQETGKLLLGCKGDIRNGQPVLNPKKPVYIDFDPDSTNPPAFVALGRKGSGKTTLMASLVHQFKRMYNANIFIMDPKANMASHKNPQRKKRYNSLLEQMGIPPAGLPLKLITPSFLENSPKYKNTDIYYSLTMDDFLNIEEFSVRRLMFQTILGIGNHDGSVRKLEEVMGANPLTFNDMEIEINKINKRNWRMKNVSVLDMNLRSRLKQKVIGDTGRINIVELMHENIVILQCSLMKAEDYNSTYTAFALAQIKDGLEAGKLNGLTSIIIDEADVLAPAIGNPPSKEFIEQAYTKWRSEMVSPWVIVQDPGKLSDTIMNQADYFLTPRIGYGTTDEKAIRIHFPSVNTYALTQLYYGGNDTYPKEWAVIDADQNVQTFFPLPTPSATP